MELTKFTIRIRYGLKELRGAYRKHYGLDKKEKVTKKDIASWLGSLAESDVQDCMPNINDEGRELQKAAGVPMKGNVVEHRFIEEAKKQLSIKY